MTLDIKICGLKTTDALDVALGRGASHVGFISFPRSPRHLSFEDMTVLAEHARGRAVLTVVTVDASDADLDAMTRLVRPDLIQLHGGETPERVAQVKALTGVPVMKAISIGTADDIDRVASYHGVADRLLLDAKKPKGSDLPGGNGVSFDWGLLARLDPAISYMLSGGLDADNVGAALSRLSPSGLDVSSGVESAPGVKDARLIHRLFDAAAAAGGEAGPLRRRA